MNLDVKLFAGFCFAVGEWLLMPRSSAKIQKLYEQIETLEAKLETLRSALCKKCKAIDIDNPQTLEHLQQCSNARKSISHCSEAADIIRGDDILTYEDLIAPLPSKTEKSKKRRKRSVTSPVTKSKAQRTVEDAPEIKKQQKRLRNLFRTKSKAVISTEVSSIGETPVTTGSGILIPKLALNTSSDTIRPSKGIQSLLAKRKKSIPVNYNSTETESETSSEEEKEKEFSGDHCDEQSITHDEDDEIPNSTSTLISVRTDSKGSPNTALYKGHHNSRRAPSSPSIHHVPKIENIQAAADQLLFLRQQLIEKGSSEKCLKDLLIISNFLNESCAQGSPSAGKSCSDATGRIDLINSVSEIAQQLTLIEYAMFEKVHLLEYLFEDLEESKPMNATIDRFNLVSYWVATEVIKLPTPKQRAVAIKQFIAIAQLCFEMNNFNTLLEITAGLNLIPVSRLHKTWRHVPKRSTDTLYELEDLMGTHQNYKRYRYHLKEVRPPCLPYLGIIRRDITMINIGNGKTSQGPFLNTEKGSLICDVLKPIVKLQGTSYHFHKIPPLFNALTNLFAYEDEQLYQYSLNWEPSEVDMTL